MARDLAPVSARVLARDFRSTLNCHPRGHADRVLDGHARQKSTELPSFTQRNAKVARRGEKERNAEGLSIAWLGGTNVGGAGMRKVQPKFPWVFGESKECFVWTAFTG